MKKITALLSFMMIVLLFACSKDSETNEELVLDEDALLVKKTIGTLPGGSTFVIDFNYDGNKLVHCDLHGAADEQYYNYTNNLITTINQYSSNVLNCEVKFFYNSGNELIQCTYKDVYFNNGESMNYVHNPDGTISYEKYTWNHANTVPVLVKKGKIYASKSESVDVDYMQVESNPAVTISILDEKNHPFKNIVGIDKISFVPRKYFGFVANVFYNNWDVTFSNYKKNVLQSTYNSSVGWYFETHDYEYNTLNYPIKKITKEIGSVELLKTEYFY